MLSSQAQLFTETFESNLANFNQSANNLSIQAGAGENASSGVVLSTNATTSAIYSGYSFDLSSGTTYTTTMDFHKGALTGTSNVNIFTLGFASASNSALTTGGASDSRVWVRFMRITTNTYGYQYADVDGGIGNVQSYGSNFTMSDSNTDWYRLSLSLVRTSGSLLTLTASIYDLGSDGTGTPTLVSGSTLSLDITNVALSADTSVYTGFRVDSNTAFTGGDNLLLVPEPGSFALLITGVLFLLLGQRRRQHPVVG